ncbi:glutathione S-transferase family protein [Kordiimonas aestuarii]|uniref:glutathione S-transferase family protein n=1 Tax=Kordiimonas aestuarii TaxID=1005925 RepID=UPI00374CFF73
MITVSVYGWVPPFARGLVRDVRVRWALEEAGHAYEEHVVGMEEKDGDDYRLMQPFGQVPVYREGDLTLFESGAIVRHIAANSSVLMPSDTGGRARVTTWMFAALNTIEPVVQALAEIDLFHAEENWTKERRPAVLARLERRLAELSRHMGNKEYLEERFSAADILMASVLRILRHTDILQEFPSLKMYQARCEARPAFRKALEDHMATFERVAQAAS